MKTILRGTITILEGGVSSGRPLQDFASLPKFQSVQLPTVTAGSTSLSFDTTHKAVTDTGIKIG